MTYFYTRVNPVHTSLCSLTLCGARQLAESVVPLCGARQLAESVVPLFRARQLTESVVPLFRARQRAESVVPADAGVHSLCLRVGASLPSLNMLLMFVQRWEQLFTDVQTHVSRVLYNGHLLFSALRFALICPSWLTGR